MAEVTLTIGDRRHVVACRDGEEAQLRRLGDMLDQRWAAAQRASGALNAERTMLLVALMLADSLQSGENRPPPASSADMIEAVAVRLEALADALEQAPDNA
ncbi:cell division protein ZapA [uncultured Sphingomonas sp.]|uniref:cell division protein ZapA n=1 Tax=uncultured Sphingomonas sp. TaxID=158754 RepID=UPI0035CC8479